MAFHYVSPNVSYNWKHSNQGIEKWHYFGGGSEEERSCFFKLENCKFAENLEEIAMATVLEMATDTTITAMRKMEEIGGSSDLIDQHQTEDQ